MTAGTVLARLAVEAGFLKPDDATAAALDQAVSVDPTPTSRVLWMIRIVVVFDGRFAGYELGTRNAMSDKYVLLNTYAEGDAILR